MIREEKLLEAAGEEGFTNYKIIDTEHLYFDSRFRMYCELNYCGNYNQNYSCPPACGEPEEMEARARKFQRALVLQTITPVRDIMDDKETRVIKQRHNQMTWSLLEKVSGELSEFLPAMAGPCGLCTPCRKAEGEACPYPDKRASCLSAYCIKVDSLAEYCEIPYWCDGKVAFFSLVFFR